jgi:hypothetical protein
MFSILLFWFVTSLLIVSAGILLSGTLRYGQAKQVLRPDLADIREVLEAALDSDTTHARDKMQYAVTALKELES